MGRPLAPKTVALQDQVLAVLRDADGFPLSTGDLARRLGLHELNWPGRTAGTSPCHRCGTWHRPPVWRHYQAEDIRPHLVRLERAGHVERIVVDGHRQHYWRSSQP